MKTAPATPAGPGPDAGNLRIAIVVSAYHDSITGALRDGAAAALERAGVRDDAVVLIPVPGAFEIPFAARQAAETRRFDAIVCLGCVIRGQTPHYDYIASAVAHGIMIASQATGVPISFGVLTTNSLGEAVARSGPGAANKGWEAAMAALQLTDVKRNLARPRASGSAA
ncbi:MAG: 6,7-dimethyl-8-ribityllumazine synthase [Acidobacteria bacterium]|nr:6,7-dimethyl-8-ribityllumazine synthase [Acidobacteriota bacterium]